MTDLDQPAVLHRRDVLRAGAVVGGGLLASALAGRTVAADDTSADAESCDGYIPRSSYEKLVGLEDAPCVPDADGWGGTFYVTRRAEDSGGDTGISVTVPESCGGDGDAHRHDAYTITADEHVELTGGPNGHGPWEEPCGSWVFVAENDSLESETVYRVVRDQETESPAVCHEGVTATDSDGVDTGSPMDLVRVSFERASPAAQWTQHKKLTSGGSTVAVDGTTAVVGPSTGDAAHVLTLTDDGWTRDGELGTDHELDGSPAISGDTVLFAGAVDGDTDNRPVLVYARVDGTWEKQASLLPDDISPDAGFGDSFDIDGETLVVGAPEDPGDNDRSEGVVYVYTRSGGSWSLEATLEDGRDITDTADGLGYDVAIDGDTVLAGAPYSIYYAFGFSSVGGGLVFTRSVGEWRQEAFLRCSNPDDEDFQGESVALEGDTAILASSRAQKDGSGENAGTAWAFTRDGSTWSQQAKIAPEKWSSGDWFASAVSLSGDRLLVGSNTRDRDASDAKGAVYVFTREGSTWSQLVKLTARDGESRDQFGSSVALDGAFAFVGARSDETPGDSDGSTYIFEQ